MFTTAFHRVLDHLHASVRAGRLHRWLVVPAVLVMLGSLARIDHVRSALVLVPPLATLPFLGLAAAAPPDSLLRRSLVRELAAGALRVVAWLGFGWSCVFSLYAGPYGWLAAGAMVPVLAMPAGGRDATRMALITMWLGVIAMAATIPLAWFDMHPSLLGAGAALLIAGGAVWLIEARLAPREESALPRAVVA